MKVVCGFSSESANHHFLSKSTATRTCGWRVKVKPGTYCASITGGVTSARGVMPFEFIVASDQFCPNRTCAVMSPLPSFWSIVP